MTPLWLRVRFVVRDFFVFCAALLTAPLWIAARLETWLGGTDQLFLAGSEFLSLFPGKPGVFLRRGYYRMCCDSFATDVQVGFGTTFAHPQVRVGKGVAIGNRCTLGRVHIQDHATIGSNVDILSGRYQHNFHAVDVPIQAQGGQFTQVRIGRNTWLGNSSVIMADVGDDSIVGAGSVVVKPIPDKVVAVGNPAAVKKSRG